MPPLLNTRTYNRNVARALVRQHAAAWRGYTDAATDQSFCAWYETAEKFEQFAYETGRHWAINMLCAGIIPPHWKQGHPPSSEVMAANDEAARRGEKYATPWGVWPATDDPVLLEPYTAPRRRRRR